MKRSKNIQLTSSKIPKIRNQILKIYIGIDNGVSGSIGWINNLGTQNGFYHIPTISEQDYTKTKPVISGDLVYQFGNYGVYAINRITGVTVWHKYVANNGSLYVVYNNQPFIFSNNFFQRNTSDEIAKIINNPVIHYKNIKIMD